jgi:hypothetical protein
MYIQYEGVKVVDEKKVGHGYKKEVWPMARRENGSI